LVRAGFDVRLAFDKDRFSVETHSRNHDHNVECADASDLSGGWLLDKVGLTGIRLDLFCGGPPCQGFSKQNRSAHDGDARNNLILDYVRLVEEIQPRMFMLENVVMLAKKRGRAFIDELSRRLVDYELFPHIYNCADYGLAQTRRRFILVGKHKSVT